MAMVFPTAPRGEIRHRLWTIAPVWKYETGSCGSIGFVHTVQTVFMPRL
jgi:hypothetical protein